MVAVQGSTLVAVIVVELAAYAASENNPAIRLRRLPPFRCRSAGGPIVTKPNQKRAYQMGVAAAVLASFLTIWTIVIRDDGTGAAYFMLIMTVMVGWFSAEFQPTGMARTMLGVAIMQVLNGLLVATAPVTANVPGGSLEALLFNGVLPALCLSSAALFWFARTGHKIPAAS